MADKHPRFSFIIVNFRSASALPACLASIRNLVGMESSETIVANNDPSEEDPLQKLRARYPFSLVSLSENRGFGTAANRAAERARGDFLVFMNPDARFLSGDFSSLAFAFEQNASLGALGFRLLVELNRPQVWGFGASPTLFRLFRNHLGADPSRKPLPRRLFPVDWTSGAGFAIPRTLFFQLHGFDERFFLYYEDTDLSRRLRGFGKKNAVLRDIRVLHAGGKSMRSATSQKESYAASQDRYFTKHRPRYEGVILKILRKCVIGR